MESAEFTSKIFDRDEKGDKMNDCLKFYAGKRVFLTGHTGFKGMWLSLLLLRAGAEVTEGASEWEGASEREGVEGAASMTGSFAS